LQVFVEQFLGHRTKASSWTYMIPHPETVLTPPMDSILWTT
jgi:hypothetical protein